MPWDRYLHSDIEDWFGTHFEDRVRRWDKVLREMGCERRRRYRSLLTEARYIQNQLEAEIGEVNEYGGVKRLREIGTDFEEMMTVLPGALNNYLNALKKKNVRIHYIVSWDLSRRVDNIPHKGHIQVLSTLKVRQMIRLSRSMKGIRLKKMIKHRFLLPSEMPRTRDELPVHRNLYSNRFAQHLPTIRSSSLLQWHVERGFK